MWCKSFLLHAGYFSLNFIEVKQHVADLTPRCYNLLNFKGHAHGCAHRQPSAWTVKWLIVCMTCNMQVMRVFLMLSFSACFLCFPSFQKSTEIFQVSLNGKIKNAHIWRYSVIRSLHSKLQDRLEGYTNYDMGLWGFVIWLNSIFRLLCRQ